jgi:hypothetical protein
MLKPSEREKLQDCLLLIQSARNILSAFRNGTFMDLTDIERCFRDADLTITRLLRA